MKIHEVLTVPKIYSKITENQILNCNNADCGKMSCRTCMFSHKNEWAFKEWYEAYKKGNRGRGKKESDGPKTRLALHPTDKVRGDVEPPNIGFVYKKASGYSTSMYSTRTLALKALRNELEEVFGRKLLAVDEMIETEERK